MLRSDAAHRHTGHWLASMLYLAPVLLLVLALVWQGRRDRRRERAREEGDEPTLDDLVDGRS